MEELQNQTLRSDWKPTIVSLILGAIITVGTTWYTIYEGKKQAMQAQDERYFKVQYNLVSIIEEHIVNQRKLNLNGLQRLIDIQIKDEKLVKPILLWDILSQAEYNILNSRHLDIRKKEEYERTFTTVYEAFNSDSLMDVSKFAEAELIKSVIKEIYRSNDKEANKLLITLVQRYEAKMMEGRPTKERNLLDFVFDKPNLILVTLTLYLVVAIAFINYYRKRVRRKSKEDYIMKKKLEVEKLRLEEEIKQLGAELDKDDNSEKSQITKERIERLQDKLEILQSRYKFYQD